MLGLDFPGQVYRRWPERTTMAQLHLVLANRDYVT